MNSAKQRSFAMVMIAWLLFAASCSAAIKPVVASPEIVLIGSTPGDAAIKQVFVIDVNKPVDFIRWELKLSERPGPFTLNIGFGEGEPNTRGFKGGGESRVLEGTYAVTKGQKGDIYKLTSSKLQVPILLVKLDENVFHLLTHENKLMVGNGGWSYALTRKDRVANSSMTASRTTSLLDDTATELIFDGRTPCVDLGRNDLPFSDKCLKLKWKITLRRDPKTKLPASYLLESTLNRRQGVEGKWTLVNGTHSNPMALILQLDPDKPNESISFLVGDENVIFFLDKNERLLTGNEDFSFTLNRRKTE